MELPLRITPNILVVDDDPTILMLLQEILLDAGYHVFAATNAFAALALAQSESIDLVITDVMMSGMNGFELREKLQTLPQSVRLPVIGVSAGIRNIQEDTFTAFLRKPFELDEITTLIELLLANQHGS